MIQYLYFGENLRQVLNSIIKAAPERIKEEDFNGFSPIEMEMMMLILCMLFERLESTHGGKRNKKRELYIDSLVRQQTMKGNGVKHRLLSDEHGQCGSVEKEYQDKKIVLFGMPRL